MLAAGLLAEQQLQLTSHLGTHSLALGLFGGGLGLAHGLLAARVVAARSRRAPGRRSSGRARRCSGPSAGVAAGVLASRWLHPTDVDYAMVAGASLLGHSAGLGAGPPGLRARGGPGAGDAQRAARSARADAAAGGRAAGDGRRHAGGAGDRSAPARPGGRRRRHRLRRRAGRAGPQPSSRRTGTAIARPWAAATWARRSAARRRRPRPT